MLKKRTEQLARNFTAAAKGGNEESSTKVDVTLSAGDFEPKCSVSVSLMHDEQLAAAVRRRANAADSDLVVALAFTLAKDADVFEVGELSGVLKEVIALSKEVLPYKHLRTECSTEVDGTRLYRLSLVFDASLHELVNESLAALNIIRQLSLVLNLSSGPGDRSETRGASLALAADVGLAEEQLRELLRSVAGDDYDEDDEDEADIGRGPHRFALLLACLRSFKLNLSLTDLEDTGLEPLLDWASHKRLLMEFMGEIATQPFVSA